MAYKTYVESSIFNFNESEKDDKSVAEKKLKSDWERTVGQFKNHQFATKVIDHDKKLEVQEIYAKLVDDSTSYKEYQKAFNYLAKAFNLNPNEIVIEHIYFKKDRNGKDTITLSYAKGLVKINIPEEIQLFHVSAAPDIDALNPTFRSKNKGQYFYPNKRIYFAVGRFINMRRAGSDNKSLKWYHYTTANHIGTAYIDPTCPSYNDTSVFIITDNSIPVKRVEEKKNNFIIKLIKHEDCVSVQIIDARVINEESISEGFIADTKYELMSSLKVMRDRSKAKHSYYHTKRAKEYEKKGDINDQPMKERTDEFKAAQQIYRECVEAETSKNQNYLSAIRIKTNDLDKKYFLANKADDVAFGYFDAWKACTNVPTNTSPEYSKFFGTCADIMLHANDKLKKAKLGHIVLDCDWDEGNFLYISKDKGGVK